MASEVPLKIRVDIRDLWDSPKSDLQTAMASLEKTLGHKIVPYVQWPILWNELKDNFADKTTFIPTISRIAVAWYERLLFRFDNDDFAEWTEQLLEQLSSTKILLHIEPCSPPQNRPKTTLNPKTSAFYLSIPKSPQIPHTKMVSAFDQDFENLLKPVNDTPGATEDGWDDISVEPTSLAATAPVPRRTITTHTINTVQTEAPKTDRLPTLGELSRPNELFANTAPYILTVDVRPGQFSIKCSHEQSLELLSSYLNRWGKQNINDSMRRNFLEVKLVESAFCMGVMDMLTVEPYMSFRNREMELNPVIVLAFIEGVLGYTMVYTNGHHWVYRSSTVLR
ncbi:hypothetical protein Hypma_002191 [Hypsizygus marmoreus]|uniref:Uncharacterized protein n=1 Tax=Hypsizygus marmoreus TaxID=39966 RepID=A0A369K5J4_HYPMA|nr:hypothetical protein Hypma_002191 [Hypsizygus marmoreus]